MSTYKVYVRADGVEKIYFQDRPGLSDEEIIERAKAIINEDLFAFFNDAFQLEFMRPVEFEDD